MTGADHLEQIMVAVMPIVAAMGDHPAFMTASLTMNAIGPSVISRAAQLIQESNFAVAHDLIQLAQLEFARLSAITISHPEGAASFKRVLNGYAEEVTARDRRADAISSQTNALSANELQALGVDVDPADGECSPEQYVLHGQNPFFTAILGFTPDTTCSVCDDPFEALVVETYRDSKFLALTMMCHAHAREVGLGCLSDPALVQEGEAWIFVHEPTMQMLAGRTEPDVESVGGDSG